MTKLYFAVEDALAVLTLAGDHGQWDLQLDGHQPQCVAVDPLQPQLVYCGTRGKGMWRSEDAGKHWRPADTGISHLHVSAVAVSRSERSDDRGVVYAGTEPSAVFRSDDGGDTWKACRGFTDLPSASQWSFPPRPETHHVRWIAPDPHVAGPLFVAIEAGALIRSPDAGASWSDRTPDGPLDAHQLIIHRSYPGRLYVAAGDGYFESRDGGESWQRLVTGLQHQYVWSVAVDSADADNVLISAARSARRSHYRPAESFLYRRTTDTPSWQVVRQGLPQADHRRTAVVAAHPTQPGTFFAAWETDVFHSLNGGESWNRLPVPWPTGLRVNEVCPLVVAEGD